MGLRIVASGLNLALKTVPQITCRLSVYERLYYNQCTEKSKESRSRLTGVSLYSSDSPAKCWKCNYPHKSEFFCKKCKALQEPPDNLNYFQVIGVDQSYDVENKDLHRKYRDLQNILHPDRFSNATEKERQISENMSSLINKAYNTLIDPLDRGLYILKLKNLSIPEGTTNLNPEFLMEIMEINEKVEEASKNKSKIVRLIDENTEKLKALSKEVSNAFRNNDVEGGKLILIKMKYYASLQARLKNHKQDLGITD